jgi:hypothetical protein
MFGPIKHLMTTPSSCLETATRLRTALLVGYGTMVGYGWLVPVNLARLVSGYHDKLNQEPVTTLHLGHWGSREWPS